MLKQYIISFREKLSSVQIDSLGIAAYPAQYLQRLITYREYYLHIYAKVLEQAINASGRQKDELVLLDYGAGNGLLGLFAKHCGFKRVYSLDVSEPFHKAAQQLSNYLQIPIDGWISGDITVMEKFFSGLQPPDIVVGTDVIEHIYDLNRFLKGLKQLNPAVVTVFTTASVTANPFKTISIRKAQRMDEFTNSNGAGTTGDHPYTGLSFLDARKMMIREKYELPKGTIDQLAIATRGLTQPDILRYVGQFLETKEMKPVTAHPTNTCDPYTGSWTERLLSPQEYRQLYQSAGFELEVSNGFYNGWQKGVKGLLLQPLNLFIKLAGNGARWISPFILLTGR